MSDVLSNDQLRVKVQGGASSSGITSSDCGTVPPAVLLELRRSLADVMEKHKCMMATESLQSDTTEKIKVGGSFRSQWFLCGADVGQIASIKNYRYIGGIFNGLHSPRLKAYLLP